MKATLLAILSSSILAVRAGVEPTFVRQEVDWSLHAFAPPGPDDVRSPCPGLNTYVVYQTTGTTLTLICSTHQASRTTGFSIAPDETSVPRSYYRVLLVRYFPDHVSHTGSLPIVFTQMHTILTPSC